MATGPSPLRLLLRVRAEETRVSTGQRTGGESRSRTFAVGDSGCSALNLLEP